MTSWSRGVLIGLPLAGLVIIMCIVVIILGVRTGRQPHNLYEENPGRVFAWAAAALALVTVGILLIGFYPYHKEYHQWRTTSGTVTGVSSRIVGSPHSVNQKFVVVIDGQEYGCDDTRCSLIKPGDTVTLSCKRVWQYTGVDGYGCNFISRVPAA